jgi:DNA-binding beta-propeller fold protein YncE
MPLPLVPAFPLAGRVLRRLVACALVVFVAGCHLASGTPPARIELSAQPNGIAVRPGDGGLFITDDRSNAILWSQDRITYAPYAHLPVVTGQPNGLSQLVFVQPDTLLVARFGFGETGAVFVVSPHGDAQSLTGLATDRRRLGLAPLGPGRVLSSWFIKRDGQPITGGVSLVSYDAATHAATERDLIAGLTKPVGLAVRGDALLVSDQSRNAILRYDLRALLAAQAPVAAQSGTTVAQVESPDLLAIDSSGMLYTKCHAHAVCRVAPDGAVTSLADDFQDARGIAVDDARHTLYVVDRAKSTSTTASAIRVIPLAR